VRVERLAVVGCVAREEGDRGLVEYMDREVGRMREKFGDGVDKVLLDDIGLDGMKSTMANIGLKMRSCKRGTL
jgi:hypothetical protein